MSDAPPEPAQVDAFIARWRAAGGSERANYQLFVGELCALLGCPTPDPAQDDTRDNAYVFERRVQFAHGDGSTSVGFIDCYRRGAFVLEAKKLKAPGHTKGFDDALLRARAQAEGYARALPAAEGRPPFVLVADVGHVIEVYAEFSRSGATYTPFPDPRSHRIALGDLHDAALRERLRLIWLDPLALDPARASARVTREVAAELALLATSLEAAGHAPQAVAAFLTRCLFSMFAEDVGLLPERGFKDLLERHRDDAHALHHMLRALWADMDRGGFCAALARDVLQFNGKLFKGAAADAYVLPLEREQVDGLLRAAGANWREVEPAIFGTLLERALAPDERHALGAHYTPRAYVERLVLPTVVQPLRADWDDAKAASLLLAAEGKLDAARAEVRRFHHQLCTTRVLDPACGSGNFLYVTLEHLKRLEGEVFNQLDALGDTQAKLGLQGETVTLQQLLGIEINPRAAALAELVLWIGFLQWHIRTLGSASVAEPVIHDYGNIECRDAVLAWDGQEPMRDAQGQLVTRWDGTSFKTHPATGERVPDETALVPQWRYLNPRPAEWPQADFIVGNPPFIGNKRMREALGDGYVEALRGAWPAVPESADFVMYWWEHAATLVRGDGTRRFGLITTNSIRQTFNRRVVERHLKSESPLVIAWAIPDHPWVDSGDGAAVRVTMTVGIHAKAPGRLLSVADESTSSDVEVAVRLNEKLGLLNADLSVGTDVHAASALRSNCRLCWQGVKLVGDGFLVKPVDLERIASFGPMVVRPYLSNRDMVQRPRSLHVIDFAGMTQAQARSANPAAFQQVLELVKPLRDLNREPSRRLRWWLFGRSNEGMRAALAGLPRFICTPEVAKHRPFQFVSGVTPDASLYVVAVDDPMVLGVLDSDVHRVWALASGGTLEDRPRYHSSRCFDTFPFPANDTGLTPELAARIRTLAEQIDAHRKAAQAAHDDVTLTGLYNVLAKLRAEQPLTAKEKTLHAHGLVAVLGSLHEELDAVVLQAFGWGDLQAALADRRAGAADARAAAVETLLERLVALNAQRAAEEAAGKVRWLRPEFQDPALHPRAPAQPAATQDEIDLGEAGEDDAAVPASAGQGGSPGTVAGKAAATTTRRPWPATLPEQMRGVADVLAATPQPLALEAMAAAFTGRGPWKRRIPQILEALEALGRARGVEGLWTAG